MNGSTRRQWFILGVELVEDLHSGTGTGEVSLDAVQNRDRRGLPVIRATHYKGVLLDGAEELVSIGKSSEHQVRCLFGERFGGGGPNQRGALLLESLYLCQWGRAGEPVIWSSSARQPLQRAPMAETLRSREFVPAGSRFKGQVLLRDKGLEELLETCVSRMDALGAERKRGGGLVLVDLKKHDSKTTAPYFPIPDGHNGPVRLRLMVRNLDPLCLPVTGYPGNIIRTECYVRGQALLGALADWAKDMDSEEAYGLLFRHGSSDVRIGNAYPLPEALPDQASGIENWDLIPIPLQLKTPKPTPNLGGGWPWWAEPERGVKYLDPEPTKTIDDFNPPAERPNEKPKRPKDHEFLFRSGDQQAWLRYSPVIQVHLRSQVPEERSEENEGELFSVFEIAEETRFLADIEFADRGTAEAFARAFSPVLQDGDWLAVGRGGRPVMVEEHCWTPAPSRETESAAAKQPFSFLLLLESDLLARSKRAGRVVRLPNLGYCETLDPHLLVELAGCSDRLPIEEWDWRTVSDFVEVRGYNAASRLQRAPARAVRRGSAIWIQGPHAEKLYQALGLLPYLGMRGREGFGRFRLFPDKFPMPKPEPANQDDNNGEGIATDRTLGDRERLMEEAISLARRILQQGKEKQLPSRTQWMDLRTYVRAEPDTRQALERLEQRQNTLGGMHWGNVELNEILEKVEAIERRGQDARLFIDWMIRWLLSEKEMRRDQ